MKKRCEKCGKEFDAKDQQFKFCQSCFMSSKADYSCISNYLLDNYYDAEGHPLKEIYIGTPQKIADIFVKSRPSLTIKQLRDVHRQILKAKTKAMLKGIESARHILYECERDLEYQLKRKIIPSSFMQFMKHHLAIAEKNEKLLEGFFKHLDSIVCYFPIKQ